MGKPTLPNLIIIGAAKAGTTSLHHYLSLHPQIHMSKKKELSFFDGQRWRLGLDWYRSNFDDDFDINGESSPRYTLYPKPSGVPQRIREILGTPKLVYIIRDPVERILSHYTQAMDLWLNDRAFDAQTIEKERPLLIHCSSYHMQLTQYLQCFPSDSILVLLNERLNSHPNETLRQVFRFLGVDEAYWSPEFDHRHNVGKDKRFVGPWFRTWTPTFLQEQLKQPTWMPWKLRMALYWLSRRGGQPIRKPEITQDGDRRLQSLFRSDVAALRKLLNDPLPEWRPYD